MLLHSNISTHRLFAFIHRTAVAATSAGLLLLSIRFLVADVFEQTDMTVFFVLAFSTFILTAWHPWMALKTILLLYPVLFGIERIGLISVNDPTSVVFSSFVVGFAVNNVGLGTLKEGLLDLGERLLQPRERSFVIVADLLAVWTLCSFLRWIGVWFWDAGDWHPFLTRANIGYSDALYPLSCVKMWLLGWLLLRLLVLRVGYRHPEVGVARENDPNETARKSTSGFLKMCLISWAASVAIFFVAQWATGLPDGFSYGSNYQGKVLAIPTSMFNDPHSLGSVAGSLTFVLFGFGLRCGKAKRLIYFLLSLVMALMLATCYSRAAWLAGISAALVALAIWRLRAFLIATGTLAILIIVVIVYTDRLLALRRPYVDRVVNLVHVERLIENREPRFSIYRRAPAMIAAHPFFGFGPGATRLASKAYVSNRDVWGADFMHNTVLQAAIEQGVFAAFLLSYLLLMPLVLASHLWRRSRFDPIATALGLAVLCFLLTQMTSNALNIYIDQQLFFWELSVLLLLRVSQESISGEKVEDQTRLFVI